MITLENREQRLTEYEIPIDVGGGQVVPLARVQRASDATAQTASKDLLVVQRRLPTTLTLTARGTKGSISAPVSDAYETIPAIAKALRERRLVKHHVNNAGRTANAPIPGDKE